MDKKNVDPPQSSKAVNSAKQNQENNFSTNTSSSPQTPASPFAKYSGYLNIASDDEPIDCYVLDTQERVISLRGGVKALANIKGGMLSNYVGIQGLRDYLDSDFILNSTIEFYIPGTPPPGTGKGITAENFLDICGAYIRALADGKLTTDRQKEIALRGGLLLAACSKVGLVALIDEATGYQYERESDALQVKIRAFIADELRDWEKTFPDELWEEFGRLTNWSKPLRYRPKWWGKLVMELIYHALDPDVAEYLKTHKPPPKHGTNYHQWFTGDYGLKKLIPHIYKVIGIAKTCSNIQELRSKVAYHYRNADLQLSLDFPE